MNEEVLEVLRRGLGDGEEAVRHGDLDDLAGSWVRDPESEKVLDEMDRMGTPIPTNDMWIAALVIQHDLLLYSRNTHFRHLPQLPRVDD